jgi:hypothetical protein
MRRAAASIAVLAASAAAFALLGTGSARANVFTLTFAYVNSAGGPNLEAWVGPGPMDVAAPVTAGTWTVLVEDAGGIDPSPAFSLTGPGVNLQTNLNSGSQTSASFSVTLQPESTYTFSDGNGAPVLSEQGGGQAAVSFTTSSTTIAQLQAAAAATPATTTTATPKPAAKTVTGPLVLALTHSGSLSLTASGTTVTTLTAGRYVLDVYGVAGLGALELKELGGATVAIAAPPPGKSGSRKVMLSAGSWRVTSKNHGSVRFLVEPAWAG